MKKWFTLVHSWLRRNLGPSVQLTYNSHKTYGEQRQKSTHCNVCSIEVRGQPHSPVNLLLGQKTPIHIS
jgi:hypothetical protein